MFSIASDCMLNLKLRSHGFKPPNHAGLDPGRTVMNRITTVATPWRTLANRVEPANVPG